MQRSFYKSTTALVISLSLLNPVATNAQDTVIVDCTPELLSDAVACLDPLTGLVILPTPEDAANRAAIDAAVAAEAEAEAEAELAASADADALAAALEAANAASAETEGDEAQTSEDPDTAEASEEAADTGSAPPCDPLDPGSACEASVDGNADATVSEVPDVAPETEAAKAADLPETQDAGEARTLTEDDTRSSNEEFENDVSAAPKAKSGGLSDLEKAGLLLLGAVVVGTIINNNEKVVANTGDRIVVQDESGVYRVYKDDDVLLMQPGATVQTQTFSDGSTRTSVLRADGTRIVTIRDAQGRVQRRLYVGVDGSELTLIDDTRVVEPVDVGALPRRDDNAFTYADTADVAALRLALMANERQSFDRTFSLRQIREIREVRELALEINIDTVTFETGSAAIRPEQAERLKQLGDLMVEIIANDPREVFLIEGHTDAVGEPAFNLALSDRRAETVALALTEYFDVPPESLIVQGYGERFLKVQTLDAERRNRRVAVRRITGLLH